ncbi:hypothetical protein LTR08_008576 [Meristemomyces frigidus]|nr:hypothetical protein LTR08_008576 [Meristemomyces frigidus]
MCPDEQKRKLCQELALILKAQAIVDDFLVDTTGLELSADWDEAVEMLRCCGDAEMVQTKISKLMRSKDCRDIVAYAKIDADALSWREIAEGKVTERAHAQLQARGT